MASEQSFKLTIPSKLSNVRKTCLDIIEKLKILPLSESDIFDLKLSIEETTINAIKYGNKLKEGLKVDIEVKVIDNKIEITVQDQGEGFDYKNVPDPTLNSNITKSSGRGLFLIRHLMDEVSYNQKGNKVTMVKYIKSS